MKNRLFSIFCVCAVYFFLISCSKEINETNSGNVTTDTIAEFSIDTSDMCSAISSFGQYYTGMAITPAELMQVKMKVTKKGKFNYSTDTLNGYYFSTEGTFDTTGTKLITLNSHGTPVTAGNSRFSFKRSSLHKTIAVIDHDINPEAVPAGFYMKGYFGELNFNVSPSSNVDNVTYAGGPHDTTSLSSFIYPTYPNPPGTGSLSVQMQYLYHFTTTTEAEFKAFLKPGAYPIAYRNCGDGAYTNGVWIGWVDDHDEGWTVTTDMDQEGSSFKILGTEDGHRTDGNYFVKIKALLNCKVYKYPNYEMKQLKDVEIVSYFIFNKP